MNGYKSVHHVDLCKGPCCPGYEEITERPPLLDPVVYCKKLSYIRPFLLKPTMWDPNARTRHMWFK